MKTIAVIIHARTDSTRCPNKHLRNLGDGNTLIDIAIDNLSKLKNVEEKYLAVGESVLAERAKGDIKVLERSYDSIKKGNPTMDIFYEHLNQVKSDYIINYNPCQPFVDLDKLQKIIDEFKTSKKIHSGITVKETKNFFWYKNKMPINFKLGDRLSTTAGPYVYEATHTLVMYKKEYMLTKWNYFSNSSKDPYPFLVDWPEEELIDVDTELDFLKAQQVYLKKNKHTVETWTELQSKNTKNVIAIDFDGVIHKNSKGYYNGKVYDDPIEGAIAAIKQISKYSTIVLYTFKGHPQRPSVDNEDGITQTWNWLKKHNIDSYIQDIVWGKPNAKVYIDDKGYKFENWKDTLNYLNENVLLSK